jgi:hypothetical protein
MGATIIKMVLEILIKFGWKKKEESDTQRADAAEKTVESVGKSLEVEKDVRDAQKEVDKNPTDVTADDGGASFGDFNSGKS